MPLSYLSDKEQVRKGVAECWNAQGSPQDAEMKAKLALTKAWSDLENRTEERFPPLPWLLLAHREKCD